MIELRVQISESALSFQSILDAKRHPDATTPQVAFLFLADLFKKCQNAITLGRTIQRRTGCSHFANIGGPLAFPSYV
jgi:hypothetical protein